MRYRLNAMFKAAKQTLSSVPAFRNVDCAVRFQKSSKGRIGALLQPCLLLEGMRRCGRVFDLVRLSRVKDTNGRWKRTPWECLTSRLSSWPRRSTGRMSLDVVIDALFAIFFILSRGTNSESGHSIDPFTSYEAWAVSGSIRHHLHISILTIDGRQIVRQDSHQPPS